LRLIVAQLKEEGKMPELEYDADEETLHAEHTPEAIRERIEAGQDHNYIRDGVLGAIDGVVTTFAVVCGVVGGDLNASVVVLLGFANLFADGFSMAVSNFEGTKSEQDMIERARRIEERHIEKVPEREVEEIKEIYRQKGFEGELLSDIAEVVTSDEELWVDTMVTEEWGLPLDSPSPYRAGGVTFGAFCLAGVVPLVPFTVMSAPSLTMFAISSVATGIAFLLIGYLKGVYTETSTLRSAVTTLLTGGGAAGVAYLVGYLLRGVAGGA
jgi:VIT1/CCC1 family predicted Fe2+/Mn2+ transporter